ncbi:MAG: polysaccharide deacetylase [Proteobacteria bacterium]|nr:polysaccharide deacetylase [Pseudomonadota bacterium]
MPKRHIVCLTFDHDNTSLFIANNRITPTMLSRGDFGSVALPRILDLLARFDAGATFFTPGHTLESYLQDAELLLASGHEIGHHGWTHRVPASLGRDGEEAELVRGIETIKRLTGAAPVGYRSPAWDLSAHSVELMLKHGLKYDSSLMGHDYDCYYAPMPAEIPLERPMVPGMPTGLVEMPISWSLDDFPYFEFMAGKNGIMPGLSAASAVLENFTEDFMYMKDNLDWGILTYTFHPFVIGRGHRMRMLERLMQKLADEGAEFLSMQDALAAWLARQG